MTPQDVPVGSNNTDEVPDEKQKITLTSYIQSKNFREVVICVIVGFILAIAPENLVPIHMRPIPYQITDAGDTILDLMYGNDLVTHETVSTALNIIIGFISLIMQIILSLSLGKTNDVHLTICIWFMANGISKFLTDWVKNYCGYLRPNFYAKSLCQFDDGTFLCNDDHPNHTRVSFLSFHSSWIFCCMTILTLYLLRLFGVGGLFYDSDSSNSAVPINNNLDEEQGEDSNNNSTKTSKSSTATSRMTSVFCLFPMLVAFFVGASRIHDNYHHPADVVAGSIVGFASAKFVFDTWFYDVA